MSNTSITLLGDSVFDNASYVPGELSVSELLQSNFDDKTTHVELLATDGAVTGDVLNFQLPRLSDNSGLIVLSTGGNDALQNVEILYDEINSTVSETLSFFHGIRENFRQDYEALLDKLMEHSRPTVVCTIYNPDFSSDNTVAHLQIPAEAALSIFNDVIVHEALKRSLDIIDLREICNDRADFTNLIEPSSEGGEKIASCIYNWVNSKVYG
jgi:hypothetical protein